VIASTTYVTHVESLRLYWDRPRRHGSLIDVAKPRLQLLCQHCTYPDIVDTAQAISSESLFASELSLCRAVQRSAILEPTLGEQASLVPAMPQVKPQQAAQSAWASVVAEKLELALLGKTVPAPESVPHQGQRSSLPARQLKTPHYDWLDRARHTGQHWDRCRSSSDLAYSPVEPVPQLFPRVPACSSHGRAATVTPI